MGRFEGERKSFQALEHKELYHDAESKRLAAASRVNELTMVVNAKEAKGHAGLEQKLSKLDMYTQHGTLSSENTALRAQSKNWEKDVEALSSREENQRTKMHFDVSLIIYIVAPRIMVQSTAWSVRCFDFEFTCV